MMIINSQQQQQPQPSQQRQLVFVVEGTAALGPFWSLLISEYVEKIVRSFCGISVNGQKHSMAAGEMALIVYDIHGAQNGCLVQQSGWTSNVDVFFRWLSAISFSGGGFGDGAIAEGLAEALHMCCPGPNLVPSPQGRDCQKHCVLIGASNPHRIPSAIHSPPVANFTQSQTNNGDLQAEQWWLADADTVAQAFPLCSVSLSVLAPRQLPLLRTIFSQAKRGGRPAEPFTEPPKQYAQHLVLLSDIFLEGRLALYRSVPTNTMVSNVLTPKIEHQPVAVTASTVSGQLGPVGIRPSSGIATGIGTMLGRTGSSLPMPPVTVKTEAVTTGSLSSIQHNTSSSLSLPMQQHTPPGPIPSQDVVQSSFTSMNSPDPAQQDFKALGNIPVSQPLRPVGPNTIPSNSMLAHSPSQSRHTIGSPSLPPAGSPLSGLQPSAMGVPVATSMSTGGTSSLAASQGTLGVSGQASVGGMGQTPIGQGVGMGSVHSSYNSGTSILGNNTMMGPTQSSSAVSIGSGNSGPGAISGSVNQGGVSSSNQMGPTMINPSVGNLGVSSGTGTMMPTTGIPQSPGQGQSHVVNNTAVPAPLHTAPATGTSPQQPPHNSMMYTKLWEGILAGRKGNVVPIPICKLEGYRQTSSPETLAADWPPTMQIMRLIPQDYMTQKDFHRKAELLVFRPLTSHDFLVQLAVKKLCAVIQLPTQTLLLASTDKPGRMIGMLFPGEMVQIVPQVPSQQPAASATAAPQAAVTSTFTQNQLQGQVQNQLPNNQLPNNQLPNNQLPNNQLPNNQLPNNQLPNSQLPNNQLLNNQLPNNQLLNNQLPNSQLLNNQLSNNQMPNQLGNQQPRSQMLSGPTSLHGTGFLP